MSLVDTCCQQCFGNATGMFGNIKYCHEHGLDPSSTQCCCTTTVQVNNICPACLGTNSAAIGMMRRIQGKW